MADKTKIEWTEASWNPVVGCSVVSPGCTNCYAMKFARRLLDKPWSHYHGTTREVNGNAVWTGELALAPERILTQPLRWKRPRRIFVNSMGDLFHEDVPDEWINKVFAVMAMSTQHTFQILTKRPERMREYMSKLLNEMQASWNIIKFLLSGVTPPEEIITDWPLPNVWLGVSVEDQARADERIPLLLQTPAALRFISCEPLIGPVDLWCVPSDHRGKRNALSQYSYCELCGEDSGLPKLDWVIVGGESGPDARPMHPDWVCLIRDQCSAASVPFFFKQWGEWAPLLPEHEGRRDWMILDSGGGLDIPDDRWPDETQGEIAVVKVGKHAAGRTIDGREWNQMPGAEEEENND